MPAHDPIVEPGETVIVNARLVLADRVETGAAVIRDGRIAWVEPRGGSARVDAIDFEGDLLAPGLVELHTDNLERHLQPRPGVPWPAAAAIVAHDAELAGCGITTVFDALRVGSLIDGGKAGYRKYARPVASDILGLARAGTLRLRHRLHLRAEICSETLEEELAEFGREDAVGIVSLMDHTPGQRQFADLSKLNAYVTGKHSMTAEEFAEHVARMTDLQRRHGVRHEAAAVAEARRLGAVLASHDDTTEAQVAASAAHGARIAEFPTTLEAAHASRARGVAVVAGAPNLLRGGSHSGNVAAEALAAAGALDALSSDYVPASLLIGALRLAEATGSLARGFAAVTSAPARAAGLTDRGRLAEGLAADLIRVRVIDGLPLLRGVWVAGRRVA